MTREERLLAVRTACHAAFESVLRGDMTHLLLMQQFTHEPDLLGVDDPPPITASALALAFVAGTLYKGEL